MATAGPLAASLSKAARDFESLLRSSECRPIEEFLEAPKLGASIPLMAELFKRAGVKSREELESTVKVQFRDAEVGNIILCIIFLPMQWYDTTLPNPLFKVRDSWEELLGVESNWDAFLGKVENNHRRSTFIFVQVDSGDAEGLHKGDLAPLQLPLVQESSAIPGLLYSQAFASFPFLV